LHANLIAGQVGYTAHFGHEMFVKQDGGSTMQDLNRRAFLGTALASLPLAMLAQNVETKVKPARVPSGADRLEERHVIGVSSTAFKVLTDESASALFVIEHASQKKGGPPRHLHHNENEWFYVIEGEYVAEIGSERFRLKPGDSILGPREVPHAWAYVGEGPGKLLIAFAPAGKMESFFRDNEKRQKAGEYFNDAAVYRAYGLELLGPPLSIG
jgi:mannose-6-phosphate isomerase-like protein (cupin superfamily)